MADPPFASASEHATSIREKEVSCRELTELYLGRIHTHNPVLHAIVISNEADAIRTACERGAASMSDRAPQSIRESLGR
jgi:Asp-tRNA(Asn)/Glu-tRNA(Gln) amidotransferase A subunit family amidase